MPVDSVFALGPQAMELTRLKKGALLLACLAPAVCIFYVMCSHWLPTPFWDEWDTPAAQLASYYRGTLSFAELASQHNEHRILFPRLIYLPLAVLVGLDLRYNMVLSFCWVCLGAIGLFRLLGYSSRAWNERGLIFCMVSLVLFSPRQSENFLLGGQFVTFVPTIALVFALLVNLSEKSLLTKTILNSILALISTYSFGNGMLVWVFAFPLELDVPAKVPNDWSRTRVLCRSLYVMMAAASVSGYFISYRHPPFSPPLVSPYSTIAGCSSFRAAGIGSVFSVGIPAINGAVVFLLFIGLGVAAVRQVGREGNWHSHYPWLALGCYALISGAITAIARLGFTFSMAGDVRYAAVTVFFCIAVVGLGFSVYERTARRGLIARVARAAAMVVLVSIVALWTITFKEERRRLRSKTAERKHLLLVARWSEAVPRESRDRLIVALS